MFLIHSFLYFQHLNNMKHFVVLNKHLSNEWKKIILSCSSIWHDPRFVFKQTVFPYFVIPDAAQSVSYLSCYFLPLPSGHMAICIPSLLLWGPASSVCSCFFISLSFSESCLSLISNQIFLRTFLGPLNEIDFPDLHDNYLLL